MITSFRKGFTVLILGNVPDWKCRIYAKEINWLLAWQVVLKLASANVFTIGCLLVCVISEIILILEG